MRRLPTFKGYTVDTDLQEFRRIEPGQPRESIPFESPKGQELLAEWLEYQAKQLAEGLAKALRR